MTFKFPIEIAAIPLAITAALLLAGFLLARKKSLRVPGFILIAIGAIFGLFFGPTLLVDTVTVNADHVEQRTGFWFAQTVKGFRLSEASYIRIKTERDRNGREFDVWEIHRAGSGVTEIDPGDLWELNTDRIVSVLQEQGLTVDRQARNSH